MKLIETELEGVFIIENFYSSDDRGSFTKTFNKNFFEENNLCTVFTENYFSKSKKDVIRGMHFQLSPFDHDKLVYVPSGAVLDVILDLRKNSKTFGKYICINLSELNKKSVYIPKGLAHGFKSLEDDTIMMYNVSTVYQREADFGISYDSFDFDWQVENPIISERDKNLISFEEFIKNSPF